MLRRLVKVVAVLLVLLLAATGVLIYSIDSIAKSAVERAGTYVLGSRTTLGDMSVGLIRPSATMDALTVANPGGFAGAQGAAGFLELGSGAIAVDARSLMSDVVRIPSIHLSDLTLNLVQKGGESNAATILANMKRTLGSGGAGSTAGAPGGRRFVIDELLIERIVINATASGLPVVAPSVNLKVERLRLESLGSGGKDPIGMDQLTAIVVNAVMQAAIEAGATQIPKELLEGMLGGIAGLGNGLPRVALSLDLGSGFRPADDLASLAGRVGVDLSALSSKVGEEISKGLGDAGKTLEEAGKSATEGIRKGLDNLLK